MMQVVRLVVSNDCDPRNRKREKQGYLRSESVEPADVFDVEWIVIICCHSSSDLRGNQGRHVGICSYSK
jgi:hypothetical protein